MPAFSRSPAMRRAGEPGLSCTSVACEGPAGTNQAYAASPAATTAPIRKTLTRNRDMQWALMAGSILATNPPGPGRNLHPAQPASQTNGHEPARLKSLMSASEFQMQAQAADQDRPAVLVVPGMRIQ